MFFNSGTKKEIIQYDFDARTQELDRILLIPYEGVKIKSLTRFIDDELEILRDQPNQLLRSRALDIAKNELKSLQRETTNSGIVRPLF